MLVVAILGHSRLGWLRLVADSSLVLTEDDLLLLASWAEQLLSLWEQLLREF